MQGYDLTLVEIIRELIEVPITVLGGAGSLADIKNLIDKYKIIGAAAGSLFVFKGKYRAVLINYPNRIEKNEIYR
jgi:cyclase